MSHRCLLSRYKVSRVTWTALRRTSVLNVGLTRTVASILLISLVVNRSIFQVSLVFAARLVRIAALTSFKLVVSFLLGKLGRC